MFSGTPEIISRILCDPALRKTDALSNHASSQLSRLGEKKAVSVAMVKGHYRIALLGCRCISCPGIRAIHDPVIDFVRESQDFGDSIYRQCAMIHRPSRTILPPMPRLFIESVGKGAK